eukprot:5784609-Prorocentrum_lima.AAC.1
MSTCGATSEPQLALPPHTFLLPPGRSWPHEIRGAALPSPAVARFPPAAPRTDADGDGRAAPEGVG